jgi:hypothetical protein
MLRDLKKRSANAALLGVDRRKAESFHDTRRVTVAHTLRADKRKELRIAAHPMTTHFACVTSRAGAVQSGRLSCGTYSDFYVSARSG